MTKNNILDQRHPSPLTVSCAPSRDEGPTVYIQHKIGGRKDVHSAKPRGREMRGGDGGSNKDGDVNRG
jgi:hypothetical protein